MRNHFRLAIGVLLIAVAVGVGSSEARGQGSTQVGGGTLTGDAMGGAALIFRKPDNPPLHTGAGSGGNSAGGGRLSTGTPKARAKAAAHERVIAKANAARSAPKPRYVEAEQQYKLAAAEDPKDARGQAGLGNTYLDQGRFADAATAYRAALKIEPTYLPVYQPLAYALVRLNRFPEAIETLKQAFEHDPNNAEIHNNLGFAYVHAERYPEAIAACRQAIALIGKTGEAYRQELQQRNEVLSNAYKNLGNAYNGLKQFNEAADALKHATEIEPKNAAAHFNHGLALYNGGRYSEAIVAYQAVIALRPQLAGAHYNLGLTYVAIDDKERAREEYNILKPLNASMAAQLQSLIKQ